MHVIDSYSAKSKYHLRLLTRGGSFSKTWSDTFRSVLIYGKEQESRKKKFHNRAKKHLPKKV